MIIENDLIKLSIKQNPNYTKEKIEIKGANKLISILESQNSYSTLSYWIKNKRVTSQLFFRKKTKKKLYFQLNNDAFLLNLDYCLEESNILHIRYKLSSNREIELSKILVKYDIPLGGNPDFTWVPHHCPGEDFVIGDHVFRSPVILYKKDRYAFAFIPDLKTLGNNRPFPTFIDFNLEPFDDKKNPSISFGFGNYRPYKHVLFKHEPHKGFIVKKDTDLTFRYYIIIFINKTRNEILHFINNFFWEKYGRKTLFKSLDPQILPFESNVHEGYVALFERHKFWGDFKINNVDSGGIWFRSWAGKNKKPIEFINNKSLEEHRKISTSGMPSLQSKAIDMINELTYDPDKVKWFDKYTRRRAYIPRTAEIWNNAFFLNMRTAYGLKYFGELWNDDTFIDKANRILNTILNIPRIKGIFPSVIFPSSPNSETFSIINGLKAFSYTDDFHVVDACLAMYWTLRFYQDFEENELIIRNCEQLVNLIEEIQLDNGEIPSYINFKEDMKTTIIKNTLVNSASSGASLMFLAEFYKISKIPKILSITKRIVEYLRDSIIPFNKWQDFEPYFSCSQVPIDTYDNFTGSHVMNTLCIYWCTEGLKELYQITKNEKYLRMGENVLSILSLFQQVWNMPYISINTFGGFGVHNADAELNDARQGLFVRTYMEYYLLTGKREYMERGIAALRACWTLQLLSEYKSQSPGNLEGLDTVDGIDKGVVYENYGHTGTNFRTPGHIAFDWGVGTAATATAYVMKNFGDLFIDFSEEMIWGINGIQINSFRITNQEIDIEYYKFPEKKGIIIKARNPPQNPIKILLNNIIIGEFDNKSLEKGIYI